MTPDFRAQLEEIVSRMPKEAQRAARRDVNALLRAGVASLEDLAHLASSEEASTKLRTTACWGLGRLKQGRRVSPLRAAQKSPSRDVRLAATEALGLVGGKQAEAALCKAMREDPDVEVREQSAFALRCAGTPRSVEPLVATLLDEAAAVQVRSAAAEALGDVGDQRAVPALMKALGDEHAEVRYWAALTLGVLRARRALPELERVAEEDHAEVSEWGTVSEAARDAIERIGGRGG